MTISRAIREAHREDADILCSAEREVASLNAGLLVSLPEELHVVSFQDRISKASQGIGRYLVAEVHDEIVGHASLWPMGLRQVSHVFRLDMCIHQGHWEQGHGRALLNALIDWARQNPLVHKVELLVRSSNTPAIHLYRTLGFNDEGRHIDRVKLADGRFVDDLAMGLVVAQNAA
jgi:putative acetyltransferase